MIVKSRVARTKRFERFDRFEIDGAELLQLGAKFFDLFFSGMRAFRDDWHDEFDVGVDSFIVGGEARRLFDVWIVF